MNSMNASNMTPKPPAESRQLVLDLRIDYEKGTRPIAVRDEDRHAAVTCLRGIWLDPEARRGHDAVIVEVFPNASSAAELLPAERAVEVTLAGPEVLTGSELAQVLLSRRAVADLDRLAHELVPVWWMDAMEEIGHRLALDLGIDLKPPAPPQPKPLPRPPAGMKRNAGVAASLEQEGPTVWSVEFHGADGAAVRRRIAAVAFGDPAAEFTLRLHQAGLRAELEMAPPPRRADVTLPARFRTGEERVFVIEVPDEAKKPGIDPSDIRASTRSDPSEPLSAEAFEIRTIDARDEGGLPLLWMRGWLAFAPLPHWGVPRQPTRVGQGVATGSNSTPSDLPPAA
jgi:hypothetical protein